jgi:hypothetical protein
MRVTPNHRRWAACRTLACGCADLRRPRKVDGGERPKRKGPSEVVDDGPLGTLA